MGNILAQGLSAVCRRLRASRVHVAVPRQIECCAAFSTSVDLAARRTWAVSHDGRRCGQSRAQAFRFAAATRPTPLRRKSFLPLGALRGSTNRGFCRRRSEPETPRAVDGRRTAVVLTHRSGRLGRFRALGDPSSC